MINSLKFGQNQFNDCFAVCNNRQFSWFLPRRKIAFDMASYWLHKTQAGEKKLLLLFFFFLMVVGFSIFLLHPWLPVQKSNPVYFFKCSTQVIHCLSPTLSSGAPAQQCPERKVPRHVGQGKNVLKVTAFPMGSYGLVENEEWRRLGGRPADQVPSLHFAEAPVMEISLLAV